MFDRAFNEILDSADKGRNSLSRKILPITLCESIICRCNRQIAAVKYFRSNILGEEIKKNDRGHACNYPLGSPEVSIRKNCLHKVVGLFAAGVPSPSHRHSPWFDSTERLT
jgi:hypothetical protein